MLALALSLLGHLNDLSWAQAGVEFKCFQLALEIRCSVSLESQESTPASLGSGSLSFVAWVE